MSHTTEGPTDTCDELDHGFGGIPRTCGDAPELRALLEQLALSAVEDCCRVPIAGAAGSPATETRSKQDWAAGLDERGLLAVTDEVLEGLRSSSEGQPEQDEMLVLLTAMQTELSGD
jgi:hypothetical protein